MTNREAAILTAFTGVFMGDFETFHKYVEEIMQRPVFTHEIPEISDDLKRLSRPDFTKIMEAIK